MLEIKDYEIAIETDRLCLRPLAAPHAKAMYPILLDRELYSFTGGQPPESEMALVTRYGLLESRKSPDESELWLNWILILEDSDVPIGYVQATLSKAYAEIAWVIGLNWQGEGYASEAAIALVGWLKGEGVNDIRCCINPEHLASQAVARNAGLKKSNLLEDNEEVWMLSLATLA